MRAQAFALLLLTAALAAGCGRAPSNTAMEETWNLSAAIKDKQIIPKDKVRPGYKPPVGVVVDGRVYPKGEVPQVEATPAPAAPESGKGHLRVIVSLAFKSITADRIRLTLDKDGHHYYHDFNHDEFVGSEVEYTFTNLEPGDYDVKTESLNAAGETFRTDQSGGTVEADDTATAKI